MKRPPVSARLPRSFYARPTEVVARDLLGKALLRRIPPDDATRGGAKAAGWIGGMIVETEAYLPTNDPACHASKGKRKSNASMFSQPGTLYVYPIHGKHCMNAVTEKVGHGCAALIRAIVPLWGIESMIRNRGLQDHRRLTRGPGMLCQALRVDRNCDGIDLIRHRTLLIADLDDLADFETVATPRVGISQATELNLRFAVRDNNFVSGPKRLR